jgi:hypothetical protein
MGTLSTVRGPKMMFGSLEVGAFAEGVFEEEGEDTGLAGCFPLSDDAAG